MAAAAALPPPAPPLHRSVPETAPAVIVIGEDHERMTSLVAALRERGIPMCVWDTTRGVVDFSAPPPPGVYFCRQSPSAACRGNASSIVFARAVLSWLTLHGARIVNNARALEVEMSKAYQVQLLRRARVNVPQSVLCHSAASLAEAAALFPPEQALIVKPNTGGSGKGVESFANAAELRQAIRRGMFRTSSEGAAWLLQAFLGTYTANITDMRPIVRFEIIGGVLQRDYIAQIIAPAKDFNLCPCDIRATKIINAVQFKLLRGPEPYLTLPGFREQPDPRAAFHAFATKIEQAFAAAGSEIGAVEAMILIDTHPAQAALFPVPHEPVVFDFNACNTNYNIGAETAASLTGGATRVADFLQQQLSTLTL